jgi:hypothetical protein
VFSLQRGDSVKKTVTYFKKPGPENSRPCLNIVKSSLSGYHYKHVVVASTTGETGLMFAKALLGKPKTTVRKKAPARPPPGTNLVIVTHSHGFMEPNSHEMSDEVRQKLLASGAKIYTGTMITHSLETALAKKFSGTYPTLLVAQTLRRFGEGTKVCCEMVMMTADAGLIPEGEEVIAVAGTARGADTVTVLKSAASKRFLDLKVLEILAKPRL